ncbi:hypothetical protein QAD02_001474 [Eretmocerus hayati]|uniref:Uncharacterized protein n=1 Tax=Eretmocerus hayati TaxID=131215 RepID=A0ACC2NKX6_9HYME|nr:hypothetical protein QAD02_001474 [Eretmocerus hayati]
MRFVTYLNAKHVRTLKLSPFQDYWAVVSNVSYDDEPSKIAFYFISCVRYYSEYYSANLYRCSENPNDVELVVRVVDTVLREHDVFVKESEISDILYEVVRYAESKSYVDEEEAEDRRAVVFLETTLVLRLLEAVAHYIDHEWGTMELKPADASRLLSGFIESFARSIHATPEERDSPTSEELSSRFKATYSGTSLLLDTDSQTNMLMVIEKFCSDRFGIDMSFVECTESDRAKSTFFYVLANFFVDEISKSFVINKSSLLRLERVVADSSSGLFDHIRAFFYCYHVESWRRMRRQRSVREPSRVHESGGRDQACSTTRRRADGGESDVGHHDGKRRRKLRKRGRVAASQIDQIEKSSVGNFVDIQDERRRLRL